MDTILGELKKYNRILILGSPGAGKTTLGRELAASLCLPLHSMDNLYWQPRWQRPSPAHWEQIFSKCLTEEKWILEGNYLRYLPKRLERADIALIVQSRTLVCLYRCAKRAVQRLRGDLNSLPENIRNDMTYKPRFSIPLKYIWLVLSFHFRVRPQIIKQLQQSKIKYIYYKR